MPIQIAGPHGITGPHGIGSAPGAARRAVLLTGASGVVGRALLRLLRDLDVVCLVHRSPVSGPNVTTVSGTITEPTLGLAEHEYADLAAKVDAVIHCAAVTDFNRTDGRLEATNVDGTQHVAAFAVKANAVLYHVSTAFVDTTVDGDRGRTAVGYASSKAAAEQVVRSSEARHVILRPSVVIGDSVTGEIASFQGLHQVVAGMFAGLVPMIPFDPAWPVDFVPANVVADAIACVVENRVQEGETTVLAAAESDQVTLTDVFVPDSLIFYLQDGESMDPIQSRGFVWFELLVSASYLGAATNLAERAIARGRGSDEERAGLAIELEAAAAALEHTASSAATAGDNDALLARALCARFATERAIERAAMSAAAALGGMSFIESPEVAYLLGAVRALAFHPPSRAAAAGPIARYLAGAPLTL